MQTEYTPQQMYGDSREEWEEAIRWLHARGAHFVLAGHDKKPRWKRWNERRPSVKQILSHKGPVGVIPASLGTTVLDADIIPAPRNLMELVNRLASIAIVRSQKKDRAHIFMRDDTSRTNGRFNAFGISGDIRSGSGYVILWGDAAPRLVEAIVDDEPTPGAILGVPQFEEWVIRRGASARRRKGPRREKTRLNSKPNPHRLRAGGEPATAHLTKVPIGERNEALFLTLRLWAYGRRRGDCYTEWEGMVRQCAQKLNSHFPTPLAAAEVRNTADSVAEFCWDQFEEVIPKQRDHDREAQARRGRVSGHRRRQQSGHLAREKEPWVRLGLSRSRYYEIRKKYRDEHDGREPTDRDFARQTPEEAVQQRRRAGQISADRRRRHHPEIPLGKPRSAKRATQGVSHREAGRRGGIASGESRREQRGETDRRPWVRAGVCRTAWYDARKGRTEAKRKRRVRAGRNLNHGGRGRDGVGPGPGAARNGGGGKERRGAPARQHTSRARRQPTRRELTKGAVADLITELHGTGRITNGARKNIWIRRGRGPEDRTPLTD